MSPTRSKVGDFPSLGGMPITETQLLDAAGLIAAVEAEGASPQETVCVTVRFTPEQFEVLKEVALAVGLGRATLIRVATMQALDHLRGRV